jgi:hypothetical protein
LAMDLRVLIMGKKIKATPPFPLVKRILRFAQENPGTANPFPP